MPGGGVLGKLFKPVMNMQIARYRRSNSPTQPVMMGFPTVLLTTVGSKSGLERTSVLGGFPDGEGAWLIVASKGGAPDHPSWYKNLVAHPEVEVQVGTKKMKARARTAGGAERGKLWEQAIKFWPPYTDYQKKTEREIPVVVLDPVN